MALKKLSPQHEIFAKEYVACGFNAARAYKNTYNCQDDNSNGSRLLREPLIRELIEKEMHERCQELAINEDRVLLRLAEMAFAEKDDKTYTPQISLKALDLIQKQLGLQKQHINANVDKTQTIRVTIDEEEEYHGREIQEGVTLADQKLENGDGEK